MSSAQGEDRSNYQPVAPWTGLDFGIVKATEGTGYTDAKFSANWANLKAEGKPRGAYHFLHPDQDVFVQAAHFLAVVKGQGLAPGDMLVVDSELAAPNVDAATLGFLQHVRAGAAAAVLLTYTDLSLANQMHQTAAAFPELWIAWPSAVPPSPAQLGPWHRWRFWQWGQRAVDKDAYNGTAAELAAWLHATPAPPVPAAPPVLRVGDSGQWVKTLQHDLNTHGASPALVVDGSFGPKTLAAVYAFQKTHGLTGDGIVGPVTWRALSS